MPTPTPNERAAAALRKDIESGAFPAGEFLPGQRELAERYGVAYGTAGAALKQLARQGLVEVIPRRGSMVLAPPPAFEITWGADGRVEPAGLGDVTRTEVQVESLRAPERVCRALQLPTGAQVVARRSVLLHTGAPWALRTLYVPRWVTDEAKVLISAEPLNEAEVLAEVDLAETGHRSIWSARPAGAEAEQLLMSASDPAHVVERTSLHGDRPVVYEATVVRSDRVFMSQTAGSGEVAPDESVS